jgi:hypothetical protein
MVGTDVRLVAPAKAKDRLVTVAGHEDTLSSEDTPVHPEEPKLVKLP